MHLVLAIQESVSAIARLGRSVWNLALSGLVFAPAACYAASADVQGALASMAGELTDVRQSCEEPIRTIALPVQLSSKVSGVHVVLKAPTCLGQWGAYDYLLVRDIGGRWQQILGGPGPIRVVGSGSKVARIDVSAMMGCELSFRWNGSTYVRHGSPECAGGSKGAEWAILERVMRASR